MVTIPAGAGRRYGTRCRRMAGVAGRCRQWSGRRGCIRFTGKPA